MCFMMLVTNYDALISFFNFHLSFLFCKYISVLHRFRLQINIHTYMTVPCICVLVSNGEQHDITVTVTRALHNMHMVSCKE